ncbi:MAG: hypothetical protein WBE93_28085 [Pseudolabrys sp.]
MSHIFGKEELAERLYFSLLDQGAGRLEDDGDLRVRDIDGRLILDCRKLAKAILLE